MDVGDSAADPFDGRERAADQPVRRTRHSEQDQRVADQEQPGDDGGRLADQFQTLGHQNGHRSVRGACAPGDHHEVVPFTDGQSVSNAYLCRPHLGLGRKDGLLTVD